MFNGVSGAQVVVGLLLRFLLLLFFLGGGVLCLGFAFSFHFCIQFTSLQLFGTFP